MYISSALFSKARFEMYWYPKRIRPMIPMREVGDHRQRIRRIDTAILIQLGNLHRCNPEKLSNCPCIPGVFHAVMLSPKERHPPDTPSKRDTPVECPLEKFRQSFLPWFDCIDFICYQKLAIHTKLRLLRVLRWGTYPFSAGSC